jgi:predicted transcriptional regulator
MKTEYKNRSIELLTGVNSRVEKILEMLEGVRPADEKMATHLLKEVKSTVEKVSQLIELS